MRCPFCGADDTQVKDSRPTDDRGAIRRRRFCPNCAARFTTFERVQLRELTVIKKHGQREPFDRDKLARSIYIALRKRPVEPDRVERIINSLVRQLESSGETDIPSDVIGGLVMEALASLDQVAYIRFASVYRNFREAKDFGDFVVWRHDDIPAYQLAVVVDDSAMQITEVVRGEDLLKSTARQLLLYEALGLEPPMFFHCPLVRDETGERLAKRHDALSLRSLRQQGQTPAQLRQTETPL